MTRAKMYSVLIFVKTKRFHEFLTIFKLVIATKIEFFQQIFNIFLLVIFRETN